jgi:serine/threonine protein kinase
VPVCACFARNLVRLGQVQGDHGHFVAIKLPCSPGRVQQRSRLSRSLNHANVVQHIADWKWGVVMQLCDGGSLADDLARNGPMDEKRAARVVHDTLRGLSFLHSHGMIHRDVKPANILAHQDVFKLCDWIEVAETGITDCRSAIGTPVFLAPEVVRTGRHVEASDTWAVACTVVNLLTGNLPWEDEDNAFAAMFKIAHGRAPPYDEARMSVPVRRFLAACFQPDCCLRSSPRSLLAPGFTSDITSVSSFSPPIFPIHPGTFCILPVSADKTPSPVSHMCGSSRS